MTSSSKSQSHGWTLFQGILLVVLGALAIAFPLPATVAIEQVFAAALLIAGGYSLAMALGSKSAGASQRIISALWALLTLVTGLLLVFKIVAGIETLTVLLVAYFAAQGIVTIIASFKFRGHSTFAIMLLSGAVSLLLAWVIFRGFPQTAAWTLGLLFGINLVFTGAFFISMASAIKERSA